MVLVFFFWFSNWFNGDIITDITDLFTIDQNNNIIAIKERLKDDDIKTQDIS